MGGTVAERSTAQGRQAIDVERLVAWTYRDCRADQADRVGLYEGERAADNVVWLTSSGDGCASVAEYGRLGARVDRSGGAGGFELNADAAAVHTAMLSLPGRYRHLVALHARTGGRPIGYDLGDPVLEPVWKDAPKYDARGQPAPKSFQVVYARPGGRDPLYCPLQLSERPEWIELQRDEYRAWRHGLVILAGHFRSNPHLLKRWRVTGPVAPAEPIGCAAQHESVARRESV